MRAAQETCSRAGSIVDPDAIIHSAQRKPAPTAAVLREGAVECMLCAVGPAASPRRLKKQQGRSTPNIKHPPAGRIPGGCGLSERKTSERPRTRLKITHALNGGNNSIARM